MIDATLGPRIEPAGINNDLAGRVEFHMRAIHGPGSRSFEVNSFGCVPAAVARALELVLGGFPIRGAAQVCAARKNDEDAVSFANDPNPIGGLETLVHARLEIRRVPDLKNRARFKECARKEEAEEHQKIGANETPNAAPDDSTP